MGCCMHRDQEKELEAIRKENPELEHNPQINPDDVEAKFEGVLNSIDFTNAAVAVWIVRPDIG